ncbi:MAG TPA: hypothetical protein VG842_03140 [Sediminibacterium sp.]|nr:hypothetical protein [Sediminibacterium sp.]
MKKLLIIAAILVYATATMGVGVQEFYCCGKLKAVSLSLLQASPKQCGKKSGMTGCCKTTIQYVKLKDTHITAEKVSGPAGISVPLCSPAMPVIVQAITEPGAPNINSTHAPPLYRGVPVYLSNRVFRI